MNEKKFKQTFKPPVCNSPPWYNLVNKDNRDQVLRTIRQETIEKYGYSMDECPKRKVCLTKKCLGRPLPVLSETAKPYIEQLKATHKIVNDELFIENCDTCSISKTCTSPCHQLNSFINRGLDKEPHLILHGDIEEHIKQDIYPDNTISISFNSEVPWDCISDNKKTLIKKYLYEGKDFLTIAKEMDLNNQAYVKYEFYSSLTRLSEFAVMRKFIKNYSTELDKHQLNILNSIYFDNKTLTETANSITISKQAVQQLLKRLVKKYNLKWTIFVKKSGTKIIYNVPGLFK